MIYPSQPQKIGIRNFLTSHHALHVSRGNLMITHAFSNAGNGRHTWLQLWHRTSSKEGKKASLHGCSALIALQGLQKGRTTLHKEVHERERNLQCNILHAVALPTLRGYATLVDRCTGSTVTSGTTREGDAGGKAHSSARACAPSKCAPHIYTCTHTHTSVLTQTNSRLYPPCSSPFYTFPPLSPSLYPSLPPSFFPRSTC